ncbi:MAG: glycoside hydrolase family 2 TIM barrel-domain containing protein [Bacteroidota bacterium]
MRSILILLSFGLLQQFSIAQDYPEGFPSTDRSKTSINQGWKFHLGDPDASFFRKELDDSGWETVHIPHTLELTSLTLDGLQDEKTQLVFHRKVGWYRRDIQVQDLGKKIFLEFEGVHQVTDVWVNGKHVGKHSVGGYTPFHFDISSFVKEGINQVTVLADNRRSEVVPPDPGPFDYVKFSGLYRDVYLVETSPVHVTFNWESLDAGVRITTPTIDPINKNATINVKTSVINESSNPVDAELYTRVIDQDGLVVARMKELAKIAPIGEFQFNQITSLEDDVKFWDTENPYLYRVNSVVIVDGKEVDFVENRVGLRKFELDPELGFMLNGKPIELIGMNRHQQYPYVGDAVPNSLHRKDMEQFKEFGFNIMRTAHYPQDNALLDACDELGILAYEEAPTWISMSPNEGWWQNLEQAARIMIRNHYNHPSIVMWGGGVNHRGYVPELHNAVKQEDPNRLTASQGARWTGWQSSGLTDINANMLYGPFIWDRSEPIFAMEGRVGPKAVSPFKADPKMTGLISWTAHAYYTFHPTHARANDPRDRTRSGMMTIFRYPRPENQWYKSELLQDPFLYMQDEWKESTQSVTIFSNAQQVELFVNDKSIGIQGPSTDSTYFGLDHPPFHFTDLEYTKGTLTAKASFSDGKELEVSKRTPEKPYQLKLSVDTIGREFVADGSDILMVYAEVVDRNGTTVSNANNLIHFTVEGDAAVIGDDVEINANPMFTEYGVAPALIRAGNTAGSITIKAKSKGLKSDAKVVQLIAPEYDIIAKNAKPIYDFKSERVDLGAPDQLVQFGWNFWNGTDEDNSTYQLKEFKEVKVNIQPNSDDGIIRWLGEMNVIGKYGYVYGDGVIGIDEGGINLVFDGLAAGTYKLTSWHHAPRSNSDSMDPNKEKLKSLTVHKLPYERALVVSCGEVKMKTAVTEGGKMQWDPVGKNEVSFTADGQNPVSINFRGEEGKGIWLNGFELTEWN